ncbi:hypothetical protein TNCV_1767661 [Trichonephila clavipes]|nr:hypothetical protein TNCV_1767661 [Trichonephila clavipes]
MRNLGFLETRMPIQISVDFVEILTEATVLFAQALHVPTPIQVACSPPKTATSTGNINSYDMGRRLKINMN